MRVGGTVNNIFIISKYVAFMKNNYSKVPKGILQINNMFHTSESRNNVLTIGGCIYITLLIIIPIYCIFVDQRKLNCKIKNGELIMEYISTNKVKVRYFRKISGTLSGSKYLISSYIYNYQTDFCYSHAE